MSLNDHVQFTSEELRKKTHDIQSLSYDERELIRAKLEPYIGRKFSARELKKLLHELREKHELSKLDVEGVTSAFFA